MLTTCVRAVHTDTLTSLRGFFARAPQPLLNIFPYDAPILPLAVCSCAADPDATLAISFDLRAAPASVDQDAVQCGAVRCFERPEQICTQRRHLHRAASEPVAWQVFFGVSEQLRQQAPAAGCIDEDAARCSETTPSSTFSTTESRAPSPPAHAHDPMRVLGACGMRRSSALHREAAQGAVARD